MGRSPPLKPIIIDKLLRQIALYTRQIGKKVDFELLAALCQTIAGPGTAGDFSTPYPVSAPVAEFLKP